MLHIRKVRTGSGATSVQVVMYVQRKAKLVQHLGSAHSKEELEYLLIQAKQFISSHTHQTSLFTEDDSPFLFVDRSKCIGVTHGFARSFLLASAQACGLHQLPPLLLDLALIRLIEPSSKQRALWLLSHYFKIFIQSAHLSKNSAVYWGEKKY